MQALETRFTRKYRKTLLQPNCGGHAPIMEDGMLLPDRSTRRRSGRTSLYGKQWLELLLFCHIPAGA